MYVPEGDPRDLPLGEALLEQVLVDTGEVPVRVGAERRPVDEAVAGGLHEQEIAPRPVRARMARVEHMMQLTRDHCMAGAGELPRANRRQAAQGEPAAGDGRAGAGEGWPRHGRPGRGPAELETDALHNLTMLKCPRFRR